MDIKVERSTVIPQPNPGADPVELPLTVFDRYAPRYHVSVLFGFRPPTPTNSAIIDGLKRTLVHYPTLTARLEYVGPGNRPCLLVGGPDGGAIAVEATVVGRLEEQLPLEPRPEFERLHPPWLDAEGPVTLLQVQLNRFECGGLIIGVTTDHRVADGQSMSNFFIAWSKSVRGAPINPLPIYDQSWLKPRSPPRCSIEHWGHEFKPISPNKKYAFPPIYTTTDPSNITNVVLHYSSDFISTKLKSQVKQKFSTVEVLLAHIWRKITMSRGLNDETSMLAKVSVNGRCRLKPAVPNEFFGNLVLSAHPQANAKTLVQGDLETAASIIHEAIRDTDDEYFRSVIDFGAMNEEEELVRVDDDISTNVMLPGLEADSLLGFRFQELDFGGGGELCAFTLSWVPLDGLVVLLPALEKDGGVNVLVGLLEEHARVLKEISHSLD